MNRSLQYEVDLTSVAELRWTRQREYTTLYFRDIRRSKNVMMLKKIAFKKKFTSQHLEQLVAQHGVAVVFVVQLQDLN